MYIRNWYDVIPVVMFFTVHIYQKGVYMTKQEIYDIIKALPNVDGNGTQLRTRCVICGDSKKSMTKKRLGIKIDTNDPKEPILYNCFNCGAHGVMTTDILCDIGLDRDIALEITKYNKGALKYDNSSVINKYKNNKPIPVIIPPPTKCDKTIKKIKYLYNRIGYKVPIEDFNSIKVIFNLFDFLSVNNIAIPDNKFYHILDRDYIGFLSINNEYIIFRDITNMNKARYFKYNIFGIFDNSNSYYRIKNKIDLFTPDIISIKVAEGIFDILSVHYNIDNGNSQNNIYVATTNSSLLNPIMTHINKGLVGDNISVDIYQDNDTKVNFYKLKKRLSPYIGNMRVYSNGRSKDFGVPMSDIEINEIEISSNHNILI